MLWFFSLLTRRIRQAAADASRGKTDVDSKEIVNLTSIHTKYRTSPANGVLHVNWDLNTGALRYPHIDGPKHKSNKSNYASLSQWIALNCR
jgi:hypothetical protein